MRKWKESRKEQEALPKVAYIELSGPITEKPPAFSFFVTGDIPSPLRDVINRLHKAQNDKEVRAVLLTIGADMSMGLAQAQEIRETLGELRRAGKKTFVYTDSYDTISYFIASSATNICLLPGGEIMVPGVGFETMFYKGAMDKVGIKADYIQIGEYKGAEEPYTRSGPSDELRGELNKLADALFGQIVDGVSISRGISREDVKQLIDDTMISAKPAQERGLVDHLTDQDGLRDLISSELGDAKINLVHDYGKEEKEAVDFSNPFAILAAMSKRPATSDKPAIALVYADGTIVDGDGGGSMFGGDDEVGSEAMRKAFRQAARDDSVKVIVLRINSPGGSALASEVMWQSVRRLAKEKPVIVSIGGMAASGGYYLASAGDYIFADPAAIVGSIGVVGGKFVMKDLFEKIGLGTEAFTKGRNAGLFSSNRDWDERQRRMVRNWMQETYERFTQRVMATRKGKIADIDKVARGRIFAARDAKALGMVDEIGGLDAALHFAAQKVNLKDDAYDVRVLPPARTLADLFGGGTDAAMPFAPHVTIAPDSVLRLLSPSLAAAMRQQIQFAIQLQRRPVVLMAPYTLTLK
jgi:protease-4